RTSTAALHARVDAEIGGLLQHPTAGYAQFLTATARGLFPIERALDEADVAAILPDWPKRSRAEALKSDLAALSVACPAGEDTVALPPGDGAYPFGVLYVLEGSRLGGGVILR